MALMALYTTLVHDVPSSGSESAAIAIALVSLGIVLMMWVVPPR
jgi:hypothetical protein